MNQRASAKKLCNLVADIGRKQIYWYLLCSTAVYNLKISLLASRIGMNLCMILSYPDLDRHSKTTDLDSQTVQAAGNK
jgi:hypothetical protein